MNTLSILLLSCRALRLNLKVLKQLSKGTDPATLKKDFDLLEVLFRRLLLALKAKLGAERIKNGTTAARKPVLKLG